MAKSRRAANVVDMSGANNAQEAGAQPHQPWMPMQLRAAPMKSTNRAGASTAVMSTTGCKRSANCRL